MSFFRGWNDYKLGFGRADGEYWLGKVGPGAALGPGAAPSQGSADQLPLPRPPGLQNLHLLTLKQKYELRVDLEDFENNTAAAKYAEFSISPNAVSAEEDGYTLYVAGFEDGGAGIPGCGPNEGPSGEKAGLALPAGPPLPRRPPPGPSLPLAAWRGRAGSHPARAWAPGEAASAHSGQPCEERLLLFMHKHSYPTAGSGRVPHPARLPRDIAHGITPACHPHPCQLGGPAPRLSSPIPPPLLPGDSLSYHSGQKFSTFDRDQDLFVQNCAALSSGAFWFRSCHFANLNGFYLGGSHLSYANGINWAQWKGFYYSLKRTEMKIRRA